MKLKQLKVHNFGKLNDREIQFKEGINIVYGPNESGKTTLHEFIKGMFYGITRQRGRASRNDLYTRYEPWENSSYFSGVLRFESGDKDFRITRNFYKNDIKEEFVCETDGERLSLEHGDMEVLLGDVSETVFDNTISIGQMRSRTDESLYQELRNYMANYEGSGDWALDIGQALGTIKKKKKEYENEQKANNIRQEAKKSETHTQLQYFQNEVVDYQGKIATIDAELARLQDDYQGSLSSQEPQLTKTESLTYQEEKSNEKVSIAKGKSLAVAILILSVGLLGVIGLDKIFPQLITAMSLTPIAKGWPVFLGMAILAALFLGWGSYQQSKFQKKAEKERIETEESRAKAELEQQAQTGNQSEALQEAIKQLGWKREQLAEILSEKKIQLDNCQMDYWEYTANTGEVDDNQIEIEALQLAMESIEEVSSAGTKRMEKQFHQRISDILKAITNGKYDRVVLDDNHEIELHSIEKQIPLWTLSKGTIEQVYFALRMAAAEIFCTEEMPILLDDVFTMYDEDRVAAALAWLADNKRQVIIFTCNTREAELADKLNLKANKIELSL